MGQCHLLDLPRFDDARGGLVAVEGGLDVPFEIRRIYYLFDLPPGVIRGEHAHRTLQQVLIPVHGALLVTLDDGRNRCTLRLDRPDRGLYIAPMIWRTLTSDSPPGVGLVLASAPYDEADYCRDYATFLAAVGVGG